MADARPYLLPVRVIVAGVEHSGTYVLEKGTLRVTYGADVFEVELGEANAGRRAQELLRTLVKRAKRR